MTIRIVLADDHEMVREGVRDLLAAQDGMEVVGEASDGASALEQARLLRPDVVVMDIGMPGGGGISATRQIRAELPEVRVVALSIHSEGVYVQAMLDAGASGYVVKTSAARDLVPAIESIVAGERYFSPEIDGPSCANSRAPKTTGRTEMRKRPGRGGMREAIPIVEGYNV